jgi:DNA-binding SARP family transcriptional activator
MLEFGVLGPLEMTIDGTPRPLGGSKQRAVLAMLVINRNRAVSADALASAAWNDRPPAETRGNIQVLISHLRKLLKAVEIDAREIIATAPPGYRLCAAEQQCDVDRFHARKRCGFDAAAGRRFAEASTQFSQALQEWRGEVLDDLRGLRFADAFATALHEERIVTITARAESELACGRTEAVVSDLTPLLESNPLREPLWAQLIAALYLEGRQSDALEHCRRLRCTLADELGIDPSPPLQELEARILRQEPLQVQHQAAATAAVAMTIVDAHTRADRGHLRDETGEIFSIDGGALRIGRMNDNDLVLEDERVSRHHAVIVDTGASYLIRDLKSSNGIYVAGTRITNSVPLSHGDSIRIGGTEFTFERSG